jgi:membrane protein implicated in regulation of membrane protease activity
MAESTLWWIVTGLLVAAELLTGTFYLLMLAIGGVAGALAAHAGRQAERATVSGALVGGVAVLISYLVRRRRPGDPSPRADRSVNLDVGETVQIDDWGADGTAQIRYRGAPWTAVLRPGARSRPGPHRVVELVGSRLLVEPV